mgnify:CR=1 FL=1
MIKTLQNTLKQDKERFTVPRSVQDIIPIRRIWPDGVFQFGSKYSKTLRFSDINYAIASKEDKTAMFLSYSELLNALDTGSTTKITINNKRLDRRNFEQEILIPPKGDDLDGGRKEYNAMLLDKVTDSSNSVVQERYITLSVHKKNVEEARAFFDRTVHDASSRLNHMDSHCEEMDAADRLHILHDFYRVGEESEFRFELWENMKNGRSFKDAICPDSMEFKKDHFIMGGKCGRVLFLKEYASYIKDSMINELTSLNRSLMLSIDIIPVPTDEAVREMQNRLLGVETNVTNWQRRQNANNNFSAVVPYDLEQQRKEALADIEETNKLLQETAQTAKTSLNRLNLLSKQILSRKKVISLLNQELDEIEKDILNIQGQLRTLKRELGDKQTNYGKSMRGLYKRHSSQDKLLFILSAESFSQSMRRMRYLREYADWQKRQANDIVEKQAEISRKQAEMEKTRAEKRALLGTRQEESKKLESEEASQKEEVQLLNKRQKDLKADLQKKRRQAEALNRQIEKQIAEEIARAEAEAKAARERAERERRAREQAAAKGKPVPESKKEPIREERVADTKGGYAMTKAEKQLSDNFANNRGRLPYPVAGRHTIVATFGEQQHQELKYVRTSNSGIDIQTSPGADARAVFNGEVTRVFVVPGYNNSVIVRHGNYLTVYSNLSQVYVKAGDRVSTRQAIGRIYSDPEDGNSTILHFQLWKEKTKLNPQPWLE